MKPPDPVLMVSSRLGNTETVETFGCLLFQIPVLTLPRACLNKVHLLRVTNSNLADSEM